MENQSSDPADFSPPPAPEIQQRRAASATAARPIGMPEPATLDDIPVYVPTAPPPVSKIAAANDLGLYSSYGNTYSVPRGLEPFTAATTAAPLEDSRLMEKINYMIHLLEEQQHERTSNVIEEVILYSFLGVFIIFICDAFARTGKYHR
jgi:hypothetical protein